MLPSLLVASLLAGTPTPVFPGNDHSSGISASRDLRYVAFTSNASNLVPGDTNGFPDVFVTDRQTGVVRRVSVDVDGVPGEGASAWPSISADGRYVVFDTGSKSLAGASGVVRKDLVTGAVVVVAAGLGSGYSPNYPSVSDDGNYATSAMAGFVRFHDIGLGTTVNVTTQNFFDDNSPIVSGNGRYVFFVSSRTTLVAGDTNGMLDVYRWDRDSNTFALVSLGTGGVQGNGHSPDFIPTSSFTSASRPLAVSADGNVLAFGSGATNLTVDPLAATPGLFVRNLTTGVVTKIARCSTSQCRFAAMRMTTSGSHLVFNAPSAFSTGSPAVSMAAGYYVADTMTGVLTPLGTTGAMQAVFDSPSSAAISDDAGTVAIQTTDLLPGVDDRARYADVFARPVIGGSASLVSRGGVGVAGDGHSRQPVLSDDGRRVAYASDSALLVANDTNAHRDVFVRNLATGATTLASAAADGTPGDGASGFPSLSGDGNVVAFHTNASNLLAGDPAGQRHLRARAVDQHRRARQHRDARRDRAVGAVVRRPLGRVLDQHDALSVRPRRPGGHRAHRREPDHGQPAAERELQPLRAVSAVALERRTLPRFRRALDEPGAEHHRSRRRRVRLRPQNGHGPIGEPRQRHARRRGDGRRGRAVDLRRRPLRRVLRLERQRHAADGAVRHHAVPARPHARDDHRDRQRAAAERLPRYGAAPDHFARRQQRRVHLVDEDDRAGRLERTDRPLRLGARDGRYHAPQPERRALAERRLGRYAYDLSELGGFPRFFSVAISGDGGTVAYATAATNLTLDDGNAADDIVVVQRDAQALVRASAPHAPPQERDLTAPVASADGRMAVMVSADRSGALGGTPLGGRGLDPKRDAGFGDKFSSIVAHDFSTGEETQIDVSSVGAGANGDSYFPSLAPDGGVATFASDATNLGAALDGNGRTDVFVRDLVADVTVSLTAGGDGDSGRNVTTTFGDKFSAAFESNAGNLPGAASANGIQDVFVAVEGDTPNTFALQPVSVGTGGVAANGPSGDPAMTRSGRYVAFSSLATNLVGADSNSASDVFVRDTVTGTTSRVSLGTSNVVPNGASGQPAIADMLGDKWVAAFESDASNVVGGDTNEDTDVFVRTSDGAVELVSAGLGGAPANGRTGRPAISPDGRFVAFVSTASNLVPGDTNNAPDVFLRDLTLDTTVRVSAGAGGQANDFSLQPSVSLDAAGNPLVTWDTAADNLLGVDEDDALDVYQYRAVDDGLTGTNELVFRNGFE